MPRRPLEGSEQSDKTEQKDEVAEKLLASARDGQDIPAENLGPQALALFGKYGTPLRRNGDRIDCHIFRDGKDVVLFQIPASADGLKEAGRKLDALASDEQKELQKQFHVKFDAQRTPRLNELYGIEAALKQSQPANLQATTGDGITFEIADKTIAGDPSENQLATFVPSDSHGNPAIKIHPQMALGILVSEADVAKFGVPDAESSIQFLVGTELAKHSLHRIGVEDNTTELLNVASKLGWQRTNDDRWLLEHRDGSLYSFDQQRELWIKRDKEGRPLGATLDPQQMQREAKIPLVTAYVATPAEELADALTLFRISEKERANVLKTSPDLYSIVKGLDQKDINEAYGGTPGKPRLLRLPNGILVSNTTSNADQIKSFEK
jgi:hypothetical protein